MEQIIVTKESKDLAVFDQLFTEAFPPAERVLPSTLADYDFITLNGFYENDKPVGMLVTIDGPGFVYILFLATFAEYRGQGIGSKIINAFYDNKPDAFTIGVIEKPDEAVENNAQRLARQKFYTRLGYSVHDFGMKFNGCDFLTIAKGKDSEKRESVEPHWNLILKTLDELAVAYGK